MIMHASSGLRPSSVKQPNKGRKMETDKTAGVVEEVVKLRYRDVALLVGEDEQGHTRSAVEAVFTYFKGGNRRPQRFVERTLLGGYDPFRERSSRSRRHVARMLI